MTDAEREKMWADIDAELVAKGYDPAEFHRQAAANIAYYTEHPWVASEHPPLTEWPKDEV